VKLYLHEGKNKGLSPRAVYHDAFPIFLNTRTQVMARVRIKETVGIVFSLLELVFGKNPLQQHIQKIPSFRYSQVKGKCVKCDNTMCTKYFTYKSHYASSSTSWSLLPSPKYQKKVIAVSKKEMYSQVNDLLVSKLSHWIHGFKLKHTLCSF
jgi:hypothetical protein